MTPSDRDAWLAQTQEEAIEPELPLCDPHHHLWHYPNSRYLREKFTQDISGGHRVVSTVFVECLQAYDEEAPDALRPVGETRFADGLAGGQTVNGQQSDIAAGIVGFADLTLGAAVQPVLEAHLAASGRFRGVRHATAWHASEKIHNAHTRPGSQLMLERGFQAGAQCLQHMGLVFDAWLYHPQLPELVTFARALPSLTIVVDHMAGPLGIGPYAEDRSEVFASWRADMAKLAECDNVFVKLGGRSMSMAGFGWHKMPAPPGSAELVEKTGPYMHACIELFGPERCMFESNFPVDKASCSYTVLWNSFKLISREYSASERSQLLLETATRVYGLDVV